MMQILLYIFYVSICSFHIGCGAKSPDAYVKGITLAKESFVTAVSDLTNWLASHLHASQARR